MNASFEYDPVTLTKLAKDSVENLGTYIGWKLEVSNSGAVLLVDYKHVPEWYSPKSAEVQQFRMAL